MIRDIYAYAFKSDLSLPEVLARLNELGPWQWVERDSDRWGEYIAANAVDAPHKGVAKILIDAGRYVINVALRSDAADPESAFADVRRVVLEKLLPAVGATDVAVTDGYD
jgi:hypothetical protein